MRDGSLLCVGKGNEDWNCSAPHGAGRLFSRSAARNEFGNVPKDVIRSSGPDDFLRSWGVSEENTDIILNFLHGRWRIKYMKLPISRDIKEYYEKQNIEFSDSEKATIIWNSFWALDEKLSALKDICDSTSDEVLKEQIQKRLETEAETKREFMFCDNNYVHSVVLDEERNVGSIFLSIDAAILYGKENCEKIFSVSKAIPENKIETDARILLGGHASFKKDGTMIDCQCYYSEEMEITLINAIEPTGFEEAYISVLNPFEYGDIVHIIGDSRPAIVVTSQEHWEKTKERQRQSKFPPNYYSNSLTVEFLYPDGEFSHGHPDIWHIEKVTEWEDKKEWELLQAVSALMKGNGWMGEVMNKYHANKWDKR